MRWRRVRNPDVIAARRGLGRSRLPDYKQGDLQKGDVREAVRAAGAVGDDRLQKQATGSINPDSFTHGTSEQRRSWFEKGYEGGDSNACDTFSPDQP